MHFVHASLLLLVGTFLLSLITALFRRADDLKALRNRRNWDHETKNRAFRSGVLRYRLAIAYIRFCRECFRDNYRVLLNLHKQGERSVPCDYSFPKDKKGKLKIPEGFPEETLLGIRFYPLLLGHVSCPAFLEVPLTSRMYYWSTRIAIAIAAASAVLTIVALGFGIYFYFPIFTPKSLAPSDGYFGVVLLSFITHIFFWRAAFLTGSLDANWRVPWSVGLTEDQQKVVRRLEDRLSFALRSVRKYVLAIEEEKTGALTRWYNTNGGWAIPPVITEEDRARLEKAVREGEIEAMHKRWEQEERDKVWRAHRDPGPGDATTG